MNTTVLLTITEVSKILHRSRSSLFRDVNSGVLPVVRLGTSLRFNAEVIQGIAQHGYAADSSQEWR